MGLKSMVIKKRWLGVLLLVGLMLLLIGCSNIDVLSKYGKESFGKMVENRERVKEEGAKKGFEVVSSEGDVFGISYIKSAEKNMGTAGLEIYEIVDAKPFIAAGLNVDRLMSDTIYYDSQNNKLVIKRILKNIRGNVFSDEKAKTMSGLFDMLIEENREVLGFHEKLGHFGIAFGEGYMLEWAKDMAANDKDIVWVLDPEPLISAGLNPDSLKGWLYTKVPVMDNDGRKMEVEKFLRAYNLQ